jgi:hypothetical protein
MHPIGVVIGLFPLSFPTGWEIRATGYFSYSVQYQTHSNFSKQAMD